MSAQRISLTFLAIIAFAFPASVRAQSNTQQPAPAGDKAAPASATPNNDAKPAAKAPAPKKVWTNENMDSLTGPTYDADPNAKARRNSYHPQTSSGPANADYYRNQIDALKAKIADIDQKLDNYEALAHGEAPGQGEKQSGVRITDSRYDIQALVAQRQKLQSQISDLEDRARHAGVEPGQLR